MKALILYVTFVIVGVALSVLVGLGVERQTSSAFGLIVFLSMFFSNFAIAWILTVLVMDGSLKNIRGDQEQRDAERIGKAAMKKAAP
jgi:hypothetical protein